MSDISFQGFNSSNLEGGSTTMDRLIGNIAKFAGLLRKAVRNDALVTHAVGTSDTVVPHGLGQVPTTWEVVDRDANAVVWRTAAMTRVSVTLRASAPVNVLIRFS